MHTSLRELLIRAGHGAHVEAAQALIQPAVRIVATALARPPAEDEDAEEDEDADDEDADDAEEDEDDAAAAEDDDEGPVASMDAALAALPLGASRFGGVPDLPPGVEWPDRDGVPMEFVAQLRLADLAGLDPDRRLPERGSLLFFYNSQWGTTDMEPDARCCAVLFHDGPDAALVRATPPRVEWESEYADEPQIAPSIHGLAALRFEATSAVPGGVSPFVQGPLREIWQDFHCEHGDALAGRTDDDEPYHANYLLGYVDEQDYVDAHANGTEDQLLLQVDSEDAAGFQWGDCNKLFFLLTRAQLAARDFDHVRVYSLLG